MNGFLKNSKQKEYVITIALVAFYLFGIIFHMLPKTEKTVLKLTEPVLFLSNTIIIFFLFLNQKKKKHLFLWLFLTILITLLIEILGVSTGNVFGSYHYGQTMNSKIKGVPFIIGINWAILILASFQFASIFKMSKYLKPFSAGIFIILFDFIMEPVAMKLDYWQWENEIVPFQNYLVWYLLSVIFSFMLIAMKLTIKSKILGYYFIVQFLFFAILNINFG